MRIAICHPHTPFMRGGGEAHTEGLAAALRQAGHEIDIVALPFKWYPPSELVYQMGLWRSVDLSEANGVGIDMVIALKFPAYLVRHERKIVWLIHQHRAAYELYDHPEYGDLARYDEGPEVRNMIWRADGVALKEAKRVFTNSENVRDRLWRTLGISSDPLYHRSPMSDALLGTEPRDQGDFVLYPSRIEPLKRQSLAIEAMRHTRTPVRLVLVGTGPGEAALRREVERLGLEDRVEMAGRVEDDSLIDLYARSLAVYYGPFDEDYGYVTLEAMAARRPVVTTTDSGGPLELVEDGGSGLVVEPSPRAIASALDRLYGDRAGSARLGERGRALLDERVPEWPEVVTRLLA
jgi:glycosyltransferase involved in cell wall biosynthesis